MRKIILLLALAVTINAGAQSFFGSNGSIIDPDTKNFITNNADIRNYKQTRELDRLVMDLKGYINNSYHTTNMWAKFYALWPMGGDNVNASYSIQAAYNLVNPSTFQLTYTGSPVIDVDGIAFNGSSQYANTQFSASTVGINATDGVSYGYLTPMSVSGIAGSDFGALNNAATGSACYFILKRSSTTAFLAANSMASGTSYNSANGSASYATSAVGFHIANQSSSTFRYLLNNNLMASNSGSGTATLANDNVFIGARNCTTGLGTVQYGDMKCGLSFIAKALTTTEETDLYNAVIRYKNKIGTIGY